MKETILPCPSCGRDTIEVLGDGQGQQMACWECRMRGPICDTYDEAEERFYRIAAAVRDHAAVVAERDALRAQVAEYQRAFGEFGTEELKLFVSMDDLFTATAPKEADHG